MIFFKARRELSELAFRDSFLDNSQDRFSLRAFSQRLLVHSNWGWCCDACSLCGVCRIDSGQSSWPQRVQRHLMPNLRSFSFSWISKKCGETLVILRSFLARRWCVEYEKKKIIYERDLFSELKTQSIWGSGFLRHHFSLLEYQRHLKRKLASRYLMRWDAYWSQKSLKKTSWRII